MNTITFVFSMGLGVALAQTNLPLPNDPLFAEQVQNLRILGAEEIASLPIPKQSLARVGFVFHDFPLDCKHPDIFANIDFTYSRSLVGGDICDPFSHHGTAMLGVAARSNNNIGIAGYWDGPVTLLSTNRRDSRDIPPAPHGEYDTKMFLSAYAMPQELVVLNSSVAFFNWEGGSEPNKLRKLLESQQDKVLVFFACGNSYGWWRDPNLEKWSQKDLEMVGCSYSDLPNVIGVSSLEPDGSMSPFSNYGRYVTLGSLGENILTACPLDLCDQNWSTPGYFKQAGTSMSSRDVAALSAKAAAIFSAEYPAIVLTPSLLKRAVVEGSCFEPKLAGSDLRTFGNPIRFCADGVLRWLRRYAEGRLSEAEERTAIQVSGVNVRPDGWVEVYGSGFAEEALEIPPFARIPYSMRPGNLRVWCGGVEALVGYASPTQVNVQLPAACEGEEPNAKKLALARSNRFGEIFPKNVVVVKVE